MEEKLRERGRPVPAWVVEGQKRPSCALKARELGLRVRDESGILERIRERNRSSTASL